VTTSGDFFYQHPKWGIGLLIGEDESSVHLVFSDLGMKRLARSFIPRLVPVTPDVAERESIFVRRDEVVAEQTSAGRSRAPKKIPHQGLRPVATFEGQVQFFEKCFPGGFDDPLFTEGERGIGKAKRSKEAAVALSQELFAEPVLAEIIANGGKGAYERAQEFLGAVRGQLHSQETRKVAEMAEDLPHEVLFAKAMYALFHGDGRMDHRFDSFVRTLICGGGRWGLATIFPGFFDPEHHTFVRPIYFRKQAEILGIDLGYKTRPSGAAYVRIQGMMNQLFERLKAQGHNPRDLMDVHSFTWVTLARAAKVGGKKVDDPETGVAITAETDDFDHDFDNDISDIDKHLDTKRSKVLDEIDEIDEIDDLDDLEDVDTDDDDFVEA